MNNSQSTPPISHDSSKDNFLQLFDEALHLNFRPNQVNKARDMLCHWKSDLNLDLGNASGVKHHIRLTDDTPFKERSRRIPPAMIDEVRQHLQEMSDLGVISSVRKSLCIKCCTCQKEDGSLRFCIDLRRLNSVTVRDAYTLPRIDDTFDALSGAKWFSTLALKGAYWQVEVAEEDKCKTAFSVHPLGFWECNRMPFGLTNAPATC